MRETEGESDVVQVMPSHYLSFISHRLFAWVAMTASSWSQTMRLRFKASGEWRETATYVSGCRKVWTRVASHLLSSAAAGTNALLGAVYNQCTTSTKEIKITF